MPVELSRIKGHIEDHQKVKPGTQGELGILRALYVDMFGNHGAENGLFQRLLEQGAFTSKTMGISDVEGALREISVPITSVEGADYFTFTPLHKTNIIGVEFITASEAEREYQMLSVMYNSGESIHVKFFRGSRRNRFIPVEVEASTGEDISGRFIDEHPGAWMRTYIIENGDDGGGEPVPLPTNIISLTQKGFQKAA